MAKFVFAYTGGAMAETPEARDAAMQAWGTWFGGLGSAVLEMGNPFTSSNRVTSSSAEGTAATALGGYSVIDAADLAAASKLADGCPVLAGGGAVDIYEAMEM